jgi:PAS domain S-box-containing protein
MKHIIEFDTDDLNNVFPFFLFLNADLKILDAGNSMLKIAPNCISKTISESYELVRPHIEVLDGQNLRSICHKLIILKIQNSGITLRGQFEHLKMNDHFLFVGSPWFESAKELELSGLNLRDFAPHNPLIDLLHVLSAQQIVNQELKELLERVNKQKNDLSASQKMLKSVSESLEESNSRYAFVNKATSEAIWDWNIENDEMYYGEGYQKLFGYPINQDPHQSNLWEVRIHPNDLERIGRSMDEYINSNHDQWEEEYRYLKADGEYAFVSDKSYIIRNAEGKGIRMIGSMQDITKRKREEQALRLMESTVTNIQESVLITSAEKGHPIIYVNSAFTRMSGYSHEEISGKNPKILQGPDSDQYALKDLKNAILKQESFETRIMNYKKNGQPYWVQFYINPVFDDRKNLTHWISIQRDVTEEKSMNDELIRQKKFNEDILNNIPADIAVFDPNHRYIFLNQHAIKNPELRQWIINKNDFEYAKYRGISNVLAEKRWGLFEQAVEKKSTVQWIDEHIYDNKKSFILRNFYPYFEEGNLKFVIGYGIDITERKMIEIQLNEAVQSVKKINDELEQFAYVASHDLQEPLRMVTSFLTQLEKKYGVNLDDRGKEYIHFAVDGAKRMRQIILDLLEYSRVGKVNEPMRDVVLDEIIEEIKLLHQEQIKELGAEIIFDPLPIVKAHRTPMRQLFQNLISNALKYHRKDIKPAIKISCVQNDNEWIFTIKDNGIGIESNYFEKIFSIFQRLHNREEYSGTGIGLAVTKKIVEYMGGKIWVESVPGTGSSFYFSIPFNPHDENLG